jgi:hypothetical protein
LYCILYAVFKNDYQEALGGILATNEEMEQSLREGDDPSLSEKDKTFLLLWWLCRRRNCSNNKTNTLILPVFGYI